MNIEELKLILTTVQAAGQGAYTLAIIWFLNNFLQFALGMGVLTFALFGTGRVIRHMVNMHWFGGKVLQMFDPYENVNYLTTKDANRIIEQIRRSKEGK